MPNQISAPPPFRYFDKGTMAVVGRGFAVLQSGRVRLSGFLAWLTWLFVHIFFLIGFRNRVLVMIQWAWSYLTYGRGARLIAGETPCTVAPLPPGRVSAARS